MYAIVEIAGLQFKVAKNQRVFVHRLDANEGSNIELDKVLLIDNNGKVTVGTPVVDGARVAAKVLCHLKGDKVLVFKKKRRKGYQKMNGHRQYMTELLIQGVLAKGEKLAADDAKAETASILELKERSRLKLTKKSYDVAEVVAEVEEPKAKKKATKAKAEGEKKAAPKKTAKKKSEE
ncbi:MAG: 50S ribosomal protein L21 [Bacteroidia bacterium]